MAKPGALWPIKPSIRPAWEPPAVAASLRLASTIGSFRRYLSSFNLDCNAHRTYDGIEIPNLDTLKSIEAQLRTKTCSHIHHRQSHPIRQQLSVNILCSALGAHLDKSNTNPECCGLGQMVMKMPSPYTTRWPKRQCPIFNRMPCVPAICEDM